MTMADLSAPRLVRANGVFIDWSAIIAGVVITTALGLIFITFGGAIGLSVSSPFEGEGVSASWFAVGAGMFLLIVQVVAFYAGGYVAGRLRNDAGESTSTSESDMRDGVHGLLVWGAGVVVAAFIAVASASAPMAAQDDPALAPVSESVAGAITQEIDEAASRDENPDAIGEGLIERRADVARKLAVISAFITAVSLLVGGVAAFFGAGLGGEHRGKGFVTQVFRSRRWKQEKGGVAAS